MADGDLDGIPDSWEIAQFGSTDALQIWMLMEMGVII